MLHKSTLNYIQRKKTIETLSSLDDPFSSHLTPHNSENKSIYTHILENKKLQTAHITSALINSDQINISMHGYNTEISKKLTSYSSKSHSLTQTLDTFHLTESLHHLMQIQDIVKQQRDSQYTSHITHINSELPGIYTEINTHSDDIMIIIDQTINDLNCGLSNNLQTEHSEMYQSNSLLACIYKIIVSSIVVNGEIQLNLTPTISKIQAFATSQPPNPPGESFTKSVHTFQHALHHHFVQHFHDESFGIISLIKKRVMSITSLATTYNKLFELCETFRKTYDIYLGTTASLHYSKHDISQKSTNLSDIRSQIYDISNTSHANSGNVISHTRETLLHTSNLLAIFNFSNPTNFTNHRDPITGYNVITKWVSNNDPSIFFTIDTSQPQFNPPKFDKTYLYFYDSLSRLICHLPSNKTTTVFHIFMLCNFSQVANTNTPYILDLSDFGMDIAIAFKGMVSERELIMTVGSDLSIIIPQSDLHNDILVECVFNGAHSKIAINGNTLSPVTTNHHPLDIPNPIQTLKIGGPISHGLNYGINNLKVYDLVIYKDRELSNHERSNTLEYLMYTHTNNGAHEQLLAELHHQESEFVNAIQQLTTNINNYEHTLSHTLSTLYTGAHAVHQAFVDLVDKRVYANLTHIAGQIAQITSTVFINAFDSIQNTIEIIVNTHTRQFSTLSDIQTSININSASTTVAPTVNSAQLTKLMILYLQYCGDANVARMFIHDVVYSLFDDPREPLKLYNPNTLTYYTKQAAALLSTNDQPNTSIQQTAMEHLLTKSKTIEALSIHKNTFEIGTTNTTNPSTLTVTKDNINRFLNKFQLHVDLDMHAFVTHYMMIVSNTISAGQHIDKQWLLDNDICNHLSEISQNLLCELSVILTPTPYTTQTAELIHVINQYIIDMNLLHYKHSLTKLLKKIENDTHTKYPDITPFEIKNMHALTNLFELRAEYEHIATYKTNAIPNQNLIQLILSYSPPIGGRAIVDINIPQVIATQLQEYHIFDHTEYNITSLF